MGVVFAGPGEVGSEVLFDGQVESADTGKEAAHSRSPCCALVPDGRVAAFAAPCASLRFGVGRRSIHANPLTFP